MSEKANVIVFGTGWACNRFINNCKNDYNIIALSDWDEKKHGSCMYGFEIISPYNFKKYKYDYIIIASQYVAEIKEQLLTRCNLHEDKLRIPYKFDLKYGKPFTDPDTRAFGRMMINYLTDLMSSCGINLYLDYGTLLGVVRDGDIINWDDDIDFSINQADVEQAAMVICNEKDNFPYSKELDWQAELTMDEFNNIWIISLMFSSRGRIIFNEFEAGIRVRKFVDGQSIGMLFKYLACPEIHFKKYELLNFEDQKVKVPYKYLEYLDLVYGNWREPLIYRFDSDYGSTKVENLDKHKIKESKETLF